MATLPQISINFSARNSLHDSNTKQQSCFGSKLSKPTSSYSLPKRNNIIGCIHPQSRFKLGVFLGGKRSSCYSSGGVSRWGEHRVWLIEEESKKKKKRVVLVRFNQGFGFNGGGGGGGGGDNSNNARILGNLALAIGLTYLSMTGQLGWVLDAIVSVWLLVVLLPIVGVGAFLWWAGRDIVQSTCPNCGNDFQIFKSLMNEELQLCPFCSQPFSVDGDEFVKDPVKFSNESSIFDQVFNDFSPRSKKGKDSSIAVVDVEAEIKDVD